MFVKGIQLQEGKASGYIFTLDNLDPTENFYEKWIFGLNLTDGQIVDVDPTRYVVAWNCHNLPTGGKVEKLVMAIRDPDMPAEELQQIYKNA
jgi:hypothetical protein